MTQHVEGRYPQPPAEWSAEYMRDLIQAIEENARERALASAQAYATGADRYTGARWIDGRPILRRIVPLTRTFLETDTTAIAHGIVDLRDVVALRGAYRMSSGERGPLPTALNTFVCDGTNLISIVTGFPTWSGFLSAHVVMEFTRA